MNLLTLKTNVIGAAAIAIFSSAATVLFTQWGMQPDVLVAQPTMPPAQPSLSQLAAGADPMACDAEVYSPVQRRCVDQKVFDAEMKRLFAALGLDAGIYQSGTSEDLMSRN